MSIHSVPRFLGVLSVAVSVGWSGGWYVDASRPDNKADGLTPSTAWRDFEPFIGKKVSPGDTLHLRRGSRWEGRNLVLYHGGTAARPFVVTAWGDPALPFPNISDTLSARGWVLGLGASHLIVEKLAIHSPNGSCVATVGDSLEDLVVQDMEISDCQGGVALGNTDGAIVQRNKIENIHFQANLRKAGGGNGAIGITLDRCHHVKVLDNFIRQAIDGQGDREDGGAVELFRGCSNVEIAYNRARNVAGFLEMGGLVGDHDTDWNVVIHHNVAQEVQNLLWCSVATAKDTTNEWGMTYREVYVDNNTQIQDGRRAGLTVGVSLHLEDSTQIRVRNNLFVGDSQAGFLFYGPFERKNNLFWSRNFPVKYEKPFASGEKSLDPLLESDTNTIGYVLETASPARDAGAILAYPASLGALRMPTIPDGNPDIGALEMSSTGIDRSSRRFQGGLQVVGRMVRWSGWAIAPGFTRLRLVDATGRTMFVRGERHPAGAGESTWVLPASAGGRLLMVDMDGAEVSRVVF